MLEHLQEPQEQIVKDLHGFPQPSELYKNPEDGSVIIIWASVDRDLTVTVDDCGIIGFTCSDKKRDKTGDVVSSETVEGITNGIRGLNQLLAWYFSTQAYDA